MPFAVTRQRSRNGHPCFHGGASRIARLRSSSRWAWSSERLAGSNGIPSSSSTLLTRFNSISCRQYRLHITSASEEMESPFAGQFQCSEKPRRRSLRLSGNHANGSHSASFLTLSSSSQSSGYVRQSCWQLHDFATFERGFVGQDSHAGPVRGQGRVRPRISVVSQRRDELVD